MQNLITLAPHNMSEQDKKSPQLVPPSFDLPKKTDDSQPPTEPIYQTAEETMADFDEMQKNLPVPGKAEKTEPMYPESTTDQEPAQDSIEVTANPFQTLQDKVRQQVKGAVVESAMPIEDRMVVKIRDDRGQLRLLLLNKDGSGFDEFGRDETDKPLEEEKINSTFAWFENNDPNVDKFLELSGYVKKAVDSSQEGAAVN